MRGLSQQHSKARTLIILGSGTIEYNFSAKVRENYTGENRWTILLISLVASFLIILVNYLSAQSFLIRVSLYAVGLVYLVSSLEIEEAIAIMLTSSSLNLIL